MRRPSRRGSRRRPAPTAPRHWRRPSAPCRARCTEVRLRGCCRCSPRVDVAEGLERAAIAALREKYPDRPLETNVEFWGAVVLELAEVPAAITPALFACARTAGWSAHIVEQKLQGRLIRPSAVYTGPAERPLDSLR